MKLTEFRAILERKPENFPRFTLPHGDQIPAHFHVTEVGYAVKKFVDCGGAMGETETCVLQTWLGGDLDHRLDAETLAKILRLGDRVLPAKDLEVEIEYDCCVVAQYRVANVKKNGVHLEFALENKRTQCLARERRKAQAAGASCCTEAAACC